MTSFRPLLVAGLVAATLRIAAPMPLPANAPALEQAYVSMVGKVLPSVVQITADRELNAKGVTVTLDQRQGS